MALGAPAELVAEATRAMADEIVHTRLCLGVASAAAGRTIGVGGIDMTGAMTGSISALEVLLDTIREGCINETICAAQAEAARMATTDKKVQGALTRIATDEQRHATLAWRTVRWILSEHPSLRPAAIAAFDDFSVELNPDDRGVPEMGVLSPAELSRIAAKVHVQVIQPCATALFTPNTTYTPIIEASA